jgi:hypothetical protein
MDAQSEPGAETPPPPISPSAYPIVLREGWVSMIRDLLYLPAGLVLAVIAIFCALGSVAGRSPIWWMILPAIGFGYLAWHTLKLFVDTALSSTVLTDEAIERRNPFGVRRIIRPQIKGYRLDIASRGPSRVRIELNDPEADPLVMTLFDQDAIAHWFGDVPTLDVQELDASRQAMLQDPRLGGTLEARARAVSQLKMTGLVLVLAPLVLMAWAALSPYPRIIPLVLGSTLPVLALALAWLSPARFKAVGPANDARVTLAVLFAGGAASGLVVAFGAGLLSSPLPALPGALAIGLAAAGLAWLRAREGFSLRGGAWVLLLLLPVWGLGLIVGADRLFDRAQPKVYPAPVLAKHIEPGRRGDHYVLDLGPWALHAQGEQLENRALFRRVREGDSICMVIHPGALGMAWMERVPCVADASRARV